MALTKEDLNNFLPNGFETQNKEGYKENFSPDKIAVGYEKDVKDRVSGPNFNNLIDVTGKNFNTLDKYVKYLNDMPINSIPTVDSNNKLNYLKKDELGGGGMPVGTIFTHSASATFVPENSLPCDGTEYRAGQFNALWNDFLTLKRLETCTYEEYQQELTATSECLKFGIDTVKRTFKVPTKLNKYVSPSGGGKAPVVGNGMTLGLTNGTQNVGIMYYQYMQAKTDNYGKPLGSVSSGMDPTNSLTLGVTKDPTKSGLETNLPLKEIRYFVVVATGAIKQSEMDWSQWASSLEGKLNIDMSNLPTSNDIVVDYKVNADGSWYRKYKSGWLEQGGRTVTGGIKVVNLVKPFKNATYTIIGSTESGDINSSSSYQYVALKADTTTTFKAKTTNTTGSLSSAPVNWYACGQGV